MEFKDENMDIFRVFLNDYLIFNKTSEETYFPFRYNAFIKKLDLGIKYKGDSTFEILDEKKWFLNKIKYGI